MMSSLSEGCQEPPPPRAPRPADGDAPRARLGGADLPSRVLAQPQVDPRRGGEGLLGGAEEVARGHDAEGVALVAVLVERVRPAILAEVAKPAEVGQDLLGARIPGELPVRLHVGVDIAELVAEPELESRVA